MARPAPTAVDTTVMFLSEEIVDGRHLPGDRLTESQLVERYDVSRSTARAALQVLAGQGLVHAVAGQPARVAAFDDDDAMAFYRMRSAFEPMLIHRFAQRADEMQVDALDRALERFEDTARASDDVRRIHRARDGFYEVLFDGADSRPLEQVVRHEYAALRIYRRQRLTPAQELRRIRINAAAIRRVIPRIAQRECSAAGTFSHRMLSEDHAATMRVLARSGGD